MGDCALCAARLPFVQGTCETMNKRQTYNQDCMEHFPNCWHTFSCLEHPYIYLCRSPPPQKMLYDLISFSGYVETTFQALTIIHAANQSIIPHLTRQLDDAEGAICSGAVFVLKVDEADIIEWTGASHCLQSNHRLMSLTRRPTLVATPNIRGLPRTHKCFLNAQILKPAARIGISPN